MTASNSICRNLPFIKMRLSPEYNVAQLKRALMKGITELESAWELKPLSPKNAS